MQESKYFYKGIPLSKYCKDNDINISTIRSRVWKKKQDPKYSNYSEQQLIDMVIEAYGTNTKYMYKGKSLRQYCLDNNLNIKTINYRILRLKALDSTLSNEELVILALEEYNNSNYRFFYQGIPLKEYCEEHPEINYNTIRNYINHEQEKNPYLSDEFLIEQYINKEHKGIYKYYYLGIPLKQYCDENNISYRNVISYMNRYRNTDDFKLLSDDEFVEAIMDHYQPFEPKYMYKGQTLKKYCENNYLSYFSVISYVKRKIAKGSNKTIDELIDEGINTINRYGIIYYYNGIPLKDYAEQNDMNASSIRCAILRKQLKSNKPLQEIVDECVETYQKFKIKYYYKDTPLYQYCNDIGLSYNTVVQRYLSDFADNPNIDINKAIEIIVDYYTINPPVSTKYYINNQSLSNFCNVNGYSYISIWRRIKNLKNKDESADNIIETAIKKYEDKLQIDNINELFNKLKDGSVDSNDIINICEELKIDYECVYDLINMNFTYNQAINMIWYFSDSDNNGYKSITDNKIKELFKLIDDIDNQDIEYYDLIGLYKSELYDTRNIIISRMKNYIDKIIFSLCNEFNIKVDSNIYKEFESEIQYYLLLVINRTSLNNYGQIVRYMDLTVKGYSRKYISNYKETHNDLSLDEPVFSDDKENKATKTRIDYIEAKNTEEDTSFSIDMMNVLSTLSKEDLSFVVLKYQENYNNEELAKHFNISLDEVDEKDIRILSLLRNNDDIKILKKETDNKQ